MTNNTEYVKKGVSLHEYTMHKYIQSLEIVNLPKIVSYDLHNKMLTMEKIPNDCVSNVYGENDEDVDEEIYNQIRKVITRLYENDIEYPDITGYNFIEYQNKLWIIDFEHTKFCDTTKKDNNHTKFIKKFIKGHNGWNPEFR
tara:strand:+ start:1005 stop:1430 length:426 start_codon:yes stop_codon:yes gene_type:complete